MKIPLGVLVSETPCAVGGCLPCCQLLTAGRLIENGTTIIARWNCAVKGRWGFQVAFSASPRCTTANSGGGLPRRASSPCKAARSACSTIGGELVYGEIA